MSLRDFGISRDGTLVPEVRLRAGRMDVSLIARGAAIRDLLVDGMPVVLGFDNLAAYESVPAFVGAIAGRCANRIAGGHLVIDGRTYSLTRNEGGHTHLHGGAAGFSERVWHLDGNDDRSARFSLLSPDGEEGYPGTVTATATYVLDPQGSLSITLEAITDAPTAVNLATHSYFNLDGDGDARLQSLRIAAGAFTPVDGRQIPTGEIRPLAGTPFDFRTPRRMGEAGDLDHNFVTAMTTSIDPRLVASLTAARRPLTLSLLSTEPGLQVYDGRHLPGGLALTHRRSLQPHGGICLEPQRFPDAPHHPDFPGVILRPGERYRQVTIYDFGQ